MKTQLNATTRKTTDRVGLDLLYYNIYSSPQTELGFYIYNIITRL